MPVTKESQKNASKKYNASCVRKDFKAKIGTKEAIMLQAAKDDPNFNAKFWAWMQSQYGYKTLPF